MTANIGKVEGHCDLREIDPDRVMSLFLSRLSAKGAGSPPQTEKLTSWPCWTVELHCWVAERIAETWRSFDHDAELRDHWLRRFIWEGREWTFHVSDTATGVGVGIRLSDDAEVGVKLSNRAEAGVEAVNAFMDACNAYHEKADATDQGAVLTTEQPSPGPDMAEARALALQLHNAAEHMLGQMPKWDGECHRREDELEFGGKRWILKAWLRPVLLPHEAAWHFRIRREDGAFEDVRTWTGPSMMAAFEGACSGLMQSLRDKPGLPEVPGSVTPRPLWYEDENGRYIQAEIEARLEKAEVDLRVATQWLLGAIDLAGETRQCLRKEDGWSLEWGIGDARVWFEITLLATGTSWRGVGRGYWEAFWNAVEDVGGNASQEVSREDVRLPRWTGDLRDFLSRSLAQTWELCNAQKCLETRIETYTHEGQKWTFSVVQVDGAEFTAKIQMSGRAVSFGRGGSREEASLRAVSKVKRMAEACRRDEPDEAKKPRLPPYTGELGAFLKENLASEWGYVSAECQEHSGYCRGDGRQWLLKVSRLGPGRFQTNISTGEFLATSGPAESITEADRKALAVLAYECTQENRPMAITKRLNPYMGPAATQPRKNGERQAHKYVMPVHDLQLAAAGLALKAEAGPFHTTVSLAAPYEAWSIVVEPCKNDASVAGDWSVAICAGQACFIGYGGGFEQAYTKAFAAWKRKPGVKRTHVSVPPLQTYIDRRRRGFKPASEALAKAKQPMSQAEFEQFKQDKYGASERFEFNGPDGRPVPKAQKVEPLPLIPVAPYAARVFGERAARAFREFAQVPEDQVTIQSRPVPGSSWAVQLTVLPNGEVGAEVSWPGSTRTQWVTRDKIASLDERIATAVSLVIETAMADANDGYKPPELSYAEKHESDVWRKVPNPYEPPKNEEWPGAQHGGMKWLN